MKHQHDKNQQQHETDDNQDYYTCSMHPEIREDKPGKCPKCGGMDLVKKSSIDNTRF